MRRLAKSAAVIAVCALLALFSVGQASAQVLREGMRGEAVRALQERLVYLGHDLQVDGIFGNRRKLP